MKGITRIVATKEQLKAALKERADIIVITEEGLARNVKAAKGVKKAVVVGILAGTGIAATNAWNPVGWAGIGIAAGITAAGASVAITAILALTFLGSLFMIMYNDYEAEGKAGGKARAKSTVSSTDGKEMPSASLDKSASGEFEFKLFRRKTS